MIDGKRHGLFLIHMLAGVERACRFFKMEIIWRADVDNIHGAILRKVVERLVGPIQSQHGARLFSSFRRTAKDASHGNTLPPQCLEMRSANKSQPDNSCA